MVALEAGIMRSQAQTLSAAEKHAVADFLSPRSADQAIRENPCPAGPHPLPNLNGWNGWGVDLTNGRFQTTAAAGLRAEIPAPQGEMAFGVSFEFQSKPPAIIEDRVYSAQDWQRLFARCPHWLPILDVQAATRMRTGLNIARFGNRNAAYFGDAETNVYA